jgi:hypothetical protein
MFIISSIISFNQFLSIILKFLSFSMLTEKDYGRGAVLGFFHNQQLFSTATITKLDRESDVMKQLNTLIVLRMLNIAAVMEGVVTSTSL